MTTNSGFQNNGRTTLREGQTSLPKTGSCFFHWRKLTPESVQWRCGPAVRRPAFVDNNKFARSLESLPGSYRVCFQAMLFF